MILDGATSEKMLCTSSIAQGGVSSSDLAIIFLDDFGNTKEQKLDPDVSRFAFQDDNYFIFTVQNSSQGIARAQNIISQIQNYVNEKRLKLNPGKCVLVVFKKTCKCYKYNAYWARK